MNKVNINGEVPRLIREDGVPFRLFDLLILESYFVDRHKPTQKEMLMFEMVCGIKPVLEQLPTYIQVTGGVEGGK